MRGLSYHQKPRTLGAQDARMRSRWPDFKFAQLSDRMVRWDGPLRGAQKWYEMRVLWLIDGSFRPYVCLRDPLLRPREGGTFEQIPHLMFDAERPERSGLCLFDPEGNEWSNKMLIADTTVWWAAEWLFYYEMWHLDGVWRGTGIGDESIAEARAAALYRQTCALPQGAPEAAAVAEG
jgi:hypothetical protein